MRGLAWLIVVAVVFSVPATAQTLDFRIFGHELRIAQTRDGFFKQLLLDGRSVHQDWSISIREISAVGDSGVVIGFSSGGGNACEGSHFILSFSLHEEAPPRIDGPLPTCSAVNYTIGPSDITFEARPSPNVAGQAWSWTAENGFQSIGVIPFVADTTRGWNELRERTANHPADLLQYGEIAEQIGALLGNRRQEALSIIAGVGSGRFEGDMFVGTSCQPHNCGLTSSLIVADIATRQVFIAWKPDDGAAVIVPDRGQWPPGPLSMLVRWPYESGL